MSLRCEPCSEQARRDAEEGQVAVLLDLLPPALLRVEAAVAAGEPPSSSLQ